MTCIATSEPKAGTVVVDDLPSRCPRCRANMLTGYGLAGGGFGVYAHCTRDCPDLYKVLDPEESD